MTHCPTVWFEHICAGLPSGNSRQVDGPVLLGAGEGAWPRESTATWSKQFVEFMNMHDPTDRNVVRIGGAATELPALHRQLAPRRLQQHKCARSTTTSRPGIPFLARDGFVGTAPNLLGAVQEPGSARGTAARRGGAGTGFTAYAEASPNKVVAAFAEYGVTIRPVAAGDKPGRRGAHRASGGAQHDWPRSLALTTGTPGMGRLSRHMLTSNDSGK